MTVRVTTLKGCEAGTDYVEQLPNYYLQSGEPRGTWLGDGAPMLGLAGEVDDDAFLALIAGWIERHAHTRLVIANRVKSPDGRWLALDARLIKGDQRTLSALYHAGLRSELTQRLGVMWHTPENGIAEIRDMPEALLAEFSIRTAQMRRRVEEKLDRFVDTMGREPTPQERRLIDREAAVDSRPRKAKSVDAASLHDGWREQARALGMEPGRVIENAVEQVLYRGTIDHDLDDAITDWSIQSISEQQSSWRPSATPN